MDFSLPLVQSSRVSKDKFCPGPVFVCDVNFNPPGP